MNLAIEPAEATRLTVVEGVVEFRNPQGSVLVAAKEQAIAKPGEAPRKVVIINPRDAVQWALYYPPLTDYRQVIYPGGPMPKPSAGRWSIIAEALSPRP